MAGPGMSCSLEIVARRANLDGSETSAWKAVWSSWEAVGKCC